MARIAVMGSGSWGTAFAVVLSDAGHDVMLWSHNSALADAITSGHENPTYHPGITLPAGLLATVDPDRALAGASAVVLALPAQTLRDNLASWGASVARDAVLVSLIKGIEWGTQLRMTQVVAQCLDLPDSRVATVTGPNLAREIAERQPAATLVACSDAEVAERLRDQMSTGYFRPYSSTDVVGAELAGAVKNVIALANGIAVGMGFGENTQAALITRGLAEMTRLGVALQADPLTFMGLAGVGDLLATCNSPLSRNRTFGEHLGRGSSVAETIALTRQTSEAVKSCRPIVALAAKHGVDMPISRTVVSVVHDGVSPAEALGPLMDRPTKVENEVRG